jgi:hypothetical protein
MRLIRRANCAAVLVAAAALAACGGGSDGDSSSGDAAKPAAAAKGAPTAEAAVQQYFTAKRTGDAAAGCALETEKYQTQQYGSAGQACLDDQANQMPQAVWAEETKIVKIDESGDSATAVIQPNAGSDAEAQMALVRVDGGWLVDLLQ